MKTKVSQNGFTLLELLLYILIMAAFIILSIRFFIDTSLAGQRNFAFFSIESNADFALSRMFQEILTADGLDIGTSTLNVSPGRLVLIKGSSRDYIEVDSMKSAVVIRHGSSSTIDRMTNNDVSIASLVFSERQSLRTAPSIHIELALKPKNIGGNPLLNFQKTFSTTVTRWK